MMGALAERFGWARRRPCRHTPFTEPHQSSPHPFNDVLTVSLGTLLLGLTMVFILSQIRSRSEHTAERPKLDDKVASRAGGFMFEGAYVFLERSLASNKTALVMAVPIHNLGSVFEEIADFSKIVSVGLLTVTTYRGPCDKRH